jgi:hypothetical protein
MGFPCLPASIIPSKPPIEVPIQSTRGTPRLAIRRTKRPKRDSGTGAVKRARSAAASDMYRSKP